MKPSAKPGSFQAVPTRFMLECAPLGKLSRAIHEFANKRALPTWLGFWAVLGMPLFAALIFCITGWPVKVPIPNEKDMALINLTSAVITLFLLAILGLVLRALLKPTHIAITKEGLSYCWKRTLKFYSPVIPWEDLDNITIVQPPKTSRVESRLLCFTSGARSVQLKISEVTDISLLPVLFQAILNHAPNVPRDPEIQSLLGLDTTNSTYTELWLKALTAPPERSRLAPLSEGTTLQADEYKIVARIGAGGQGVAYTAVQRSRADLDTLVVLKEYVLPVGVSHSNKVESLEKFQHEAKILSQINHPQVVKLLDFFFEDHRGYMVLEHIKGQSLNVIVNESGPMAEPVVIDLAAQMANILSYLHSQDPPIVHRDFTPDNLILNNDGVLKLIDFNVAQQKRSTVTATVVGKHAYIAPDQFRGHPSPQSDIYSLGATLSYLLTGHDPKPISQSHPKTKNETVREELDDIVATCTAVELAARFKSAEELASRLKELKDKKAHSEVISVLKPESIET